MATDLAKLVVKMEAQAGKLHKELDRANRKISNFERKTQTSLKKVSNSFKAVFAGAALGVAVTKFGQSVLQTSRNIEQLKIQLETVTGSAQNAESAFAMVQNFAEQTPFQLEELVASFVKLKALGLDPSEKALKSYGNTASAMGKSLNQMIEAVADASVFEFERLKEFGIKARQETDSVSLTFQGVTTKVGKNAQEIIQYLQDIGNVQFAGAMEKQADTLSGAFSNLQDALTNALAVQGPALQELTDSVKEFADVLKDPDTVNAIQTLATGLVKLGATAVKATAAFTNATVSLTAEIARLTHGAYDAKGALKTLQEQLNAVRFAGGSNLEGLIESFEKVEKLVDLAPLADIEDGLEQIAEQIAYINDLNARGLGSEQLELEATILKDLRNVYLDARDAKEAFISAGSATDKGDAGASPAVVISETEIKALERYNQQMQKLGQSITESVNPQALFNRQQDELIKLLDEGFISLETYLAKHKEYSEQLQKSVSDTDSKTSDMEAISEQAARNMQSAFADFLFDPFDKGLDGMLKSFLKIIQRMMAERAAMALLNAIMGKPATDTPKAPIVDKSTSLEGGGYTGNAPRMGGLDGKGGFMAMLHPQETVIDHTKGQGQEPVTVHFNISAIDTQGFEDFAHRNRGIFTNVINQALNNSGRASLV
jgi:hypothetical protein